METTKEELQKMAADSANIHFNMHHEGDWYAHYYGFIYGYQQSEQKKLQQHSVMQAEGSDVCEGAAVGQRSVDTVAARGIEPCTCPDQFCLLGDHPTCRWAEYARKSSEGQP